MSLVTTFKPQPVQLKIAKLRNKMSQNLIETGTIIVPPTPCKIDGLLAIGEAPGKDEEIMGEGFAGISGRNLDRLLNDNGITRQNYGRANVYMLRPPNNRKPTKAELNQSLPSLAQFISETRPKVVLTVGSTAAEVFCGIGPLYAKIQQGLQNNSWDASNYLELAHPSIIPILPYIKYIVPSPHTSPLAFNRNSPSGEKWSVIAAKQIKIAVKLLQL